MTWFETLFSKNSKKGLKLKFSKQNDSWIVTRNQEIVFMGGEAQCKTYITNFEESEEEKLSGIN